MKNIIFNLVHTCGFSLRGNRRGGPYNQHSMEVKYFLMLVKHPEFLLIMCMLIQFQDCEADGVLNCCDYQTCKLKSGAMCAEGACCHECQVCIVSMVVSFHIERYNTCVYCR